MLFIVKILAKTLTVLNSEISPRQIAAGFAMGVWIGLLPLSGLMPMVLLLLAFLININLAILFVAAGVFKILAYLIDPLANQVGYFFLTKVAGLQGLWTTLYNAPVIPYTKFNNTIVMGSFVIGFLLLVPMYVLGSWGVVRYRSGWREKIQQLKIMKVLKASSFYKFYLTYKGLRSGL